VESWPPPATRGEVGGGHRGGWRGASALTGNIGSASVRVRACPHGSPITLRAGRPRSSRPGLAATDVEDRVEALVPPAWAPTERIQVSAAGSARPLRRRLRLLGSKA